MNFFMSFPFAGSLNVLQPARAVADLVQVDVVTVEHTQQQVAGRHLPLRIRDVAVALQSSGATAEHEVRQIDVRMLVRVADPPAYQQDDVVEVPAVRHVVPADEADPELLLVLADLAREERLHEELEERVPTSPDGEVGREDGHGRKIPPGGADAEPIRRTAIVARRRRRPTRADRPPSPGPLRPAARRPSSSPRRAGGGGPGRHGGAPGGERAAISASS